MGADLAETPLYVSIRDYFTRQPYVTTDGQTSLNIPVESVEVTNVMWEPKVNDISTAKITLPSLIAQPGLRPLLQQIKEGNRVEVFHFQPDAGDPVFAGFLGPEGIDEQDGKVILTVDDALGQLRWQHVRRFESYNQNASGFYDRAMMVWQDFLNEDFLGTNPSADYDITNLLGAVPIWGSGYLRLNSNGTPSCGTDISAKLPLHTTVGPGDVWMLEADISMSTAFSAAAFVQARLNFNDDSGNPLFDSFVTYRGSNFSGGVTYPRNLLCDSGVKFPDGSTSTPAGGTSQTASAFVMPKSHRLTSFMRFDAASVTVQTYLDGIFASSWTWPWTYTSTDLWRPRWDLQADVSGDWIQFNRLRARRLVRVLLRGGRFNPQTPDAVTYQPNNEDNLQLLQLFAEKDNAEFRPIYRAWPQLDELELDAAGTLGAYASRVLGYEQPPNIPVGGAPEPAPFAAITDAASFLVEPPFRFEEGRNLQSPPRIQPRANSHSNNVIRAGASTSEAQVLSEIWAPTETGKPQHSPAGTVYPYFEQITNDDRVGIQAVNDSLASLELSRRIDPTPSLELDVVEDLAWAGRWRAGDQVFVKTLSLRTNLEQEMRVQKLQYRAGSPVRTATMGKTDWDPSMQRLLAEDTKISWLYDQSGTNPGIYIYPFLGNILSGVTSTAFAIPLDQYTTGSAIVYAALHWFTDANVLNVQPIINGVGVHLTQIVAASSTDSGLVFATQYFQSPGTYQIQFKNNDAGTRNLTAAFLVLRLKA